MTRSAWNKHSFNYISDYFNENGFIIIEEEPEYFSVNTNLNIKDVDGYLFYISMSRLHSCLKRGYKPERFDAKNPFAINNINLWIRDNNKTIVCISDDYFGAKKKINFQCLNEGCEEEFEMAWENIYSKGSQCPYCAGKRVCHKNSFGYNFPELLKDWDYNKNSLSPFDYTYGSGKPVWWKCNKCGFNWRVSIHNRTSLDRGCPACSTSKGEKKVSDFLILNSIEFKKQMSFPDCRWNDGGLLRFDFYIIKENLIIEYDGIQHFKPVKFGGISQEEAKENFKNQKIKDKIKTKYCKKNNILLLRIPHWKFEKIEEILEKSLFE